MNTSYSIWPIFVVPYNLPPWACMDQSNFMMVIWYVWTCERWYVLCAMCAENVDWYEDVICAEIIYCYLIFCCAVKLIFLLCCEIYNLLWCEKIWERIVRAWPKNHQIVKGLAQYYCMKYLGFWKASAQTNITKFEFKFQMNWTIKFQKPKKLALSKG
jgi:hypothetical protein